MCASRRIPNKTLSSATIQVTRGCWSLPLPLSLCLCNHLFYQTSRRWDGRTPEVRAICGRWGGRAFSGWPMTSPAELITSACCRSAQQALWAVASYIICRALCCIMHYSSCNVLHFTLWIVSGLHNLPHPDCLAGIRENGERMRKWREVHSLHFLIFSLFPPSLSIF